MVHFSNTINIPLEQIVITCAECGEKATAAAINADKERYHKAGTGKMVHFPNAGLTPEQLEKLSQMAFYCECCQEDLP